MQKAIRGIKQLTKAILPAAAINFIRKMKTERLPRIDLSVLEHLKKQVRKN